MTAPMQCPKCGFSQPPSEECARCGVLVNRVHERPAAAPPAAYAPTSQPAPRSGLSSIVPVLGFFAATAALLVFLRPRGRDAVPRPRHEARAAGQAVSFASSSWHEGADGYRRADEERRRDGKPMALYFHTSWCGWCKKMDAEILDASETREYLAGIAKVRIDPESGSEEAELARSYGVRGYPTFLIVPASGGGARQVHPFTTRGTMTAAQFVAACRDAE